VERSDIWKAYAESLMHRPEVMIVEDPSSVCEEIGEAEEMVEGGIYAVKRTYQPSTLKRKRTHGFLHRNRVAKHILRNRRRKGRHRLVPC